MHAERPSERAVASLPILLTKFSGPAPLSFSTDRSYKLLGRQLWAVLSSEKSRSPATAIRVSKSRHNSRTKLRMKLLHNIFKSEIMSSFTCVASFNSHLSACAAKLM